MSPRLLLAIALASLALIAVLYAVASSRISDQLPQPDAAEPLMPAVEDSSRLDTAPDAAEDDTSARQPEQEAVAVPANAAAAAPNGAGDAEASAESQPLAEEAVGDSAPAEEAASNSDLSN